LTTISATAGMTRQTGSVYWGLLMVILFCLINCDIANLVHDLVRNCPFGPLNKTVGHPGCSSNSKTATSWVLYYAIVTMPGQQAVPTTCTFKLLLQLV